MEEINNIFVAALNLIISLDQLIFATCRRLGQQASLRLLNEYTTGAAFFKDYNL